MTDNLRDRILHVLINNTPPKYLAMPEDLSNLVTALIRELKWRQEYSVEYTPKGCSPPINQLYQWSCGHERITNNRDAALWDATSFYGEEPGELPHVVTRYVTEWETDETD